MSDPEIKFAKSIGWNAGERVARWAMIIDHGKITYAEKEPERGVTVSPTVVKCIVVEKVVLTRIARFRGLKLFFRSCKM